MTNLRCHVISNTHWDREWRYPFQAYRMDLVDMMDRLLDVMEKRPDYRAFYLDSQTVILDDYLEIRPGAESRIRKVVEEGRLEIGPWYTLPDMWGCPGEALVRNLLMGHRAAKRFGKVVKTGYTPFSNGQISQLPQIYAGFGIDSCMFYRGIAKHVAKSEFVWKAPDGSRVFGFRFGDYARYNYYYLLYRPGLLSRTIRDRDYVWTPGEVPYHVAAEQAQDRQYGYINQKLVVDEGKLDEAIADARKFTAADATTSQLLYMMGHDHSFGAEEELDLINAIQKRLAGSGEEVIHGSLTDYMEAFRSEAADLQVLRGEMRHTLKEGLWTTLMALILSCRTYLKQQNARVSAKVLGGAEPLAAMAWMTGSAYPAPFLDEAWKRLLINQAHDAVGGCSVDRVHEEMQARWGEVETLSDEICRRSMRDVAARVDGSAIAPADTQLTVFNPLPYDRSGVADFIIDIPTDDKAATFALERADGTPVPLQIVARESYTATIEGGYELNMPFPVQRFRTCVLLDDVPATGYEALAVRTGMAPDIAPGAIALSDRELENEYLHVAVNDNGTLRLTDKVSGRIMDKLGYFEDTAEFGDPWSRAVPRGDRPIRSLRARAKSEVLENGGLRGALKVSLELSLPAGKGEDGKRSAARVKIPVSMIVGLKKNSKAVEVTVHLENRAENHRLRIMFPTGIAKAKSSFAEGQFDVLERPIKLPDATGWKEPPYPTNPMWTFVDISDGRDGFSVVNDGLIEYEAVNDRARTVAITLLRAFGTFTFGRPTPGSQCLGEHCYRFLLFPHAGYWSESQVFEESRRLTVPLQAIQSAPTQGQLPCRASLLRLTGGQAVFSGMKQSEDGKSLILRFWNPLDHEQAVRVESGMMLLKCSLVTLEEKPVGELAVALEGRAVDITVPAKKIMTVGLQWEPRQP
jgi:alpha-mannosidase